jgi:LCP family protein required for cell wall assembly
MLTSGDDSRSVLDSLWMREFQAYTRERQGTRRSSWWMWALPVVLFALFVGIELVAGPVSIERLTRVSSPDSGKVEASPSDWVERMFGGQPGLADGPLNVLVLGVDTRPDSQEMGSRTDTIMLVHVVPKTGDVKLLSVPRDLFVEVKPGEKDKVNAAYNYGGVNETIDALENYSGEPVDHYAVVDFEGFQRVIDAMGGVRVDVGEGQFPEKWRMGEDVQRLNGHKALIFARYRGTPGADLDRMQRQRELVGALRSEALKWHTIKTLPEIMAVMNENVQTDLDLGGAITLGRVLIRKGRHAEMTSQQLKGTPETLPNGEQVLIPDEDANNAILDGFRH